MSDLVLFQREDKDTRRLRDLFRGQLAWPSLGQRLKIQGSVSIGQMRGGQTLDTGMAVVTSHWET